MKNIYNNYIIPFAYIKKNTDDIESIFSIECSDINLNKDNKIKLISSIINKILTRGKKGLLSEFEENNILKYFGQDINYFEKTNINKNVENKIITILNIIYKLELSINNGFFNGNIDFNDNNNIVIDLDYKLIDYEDKKLIINLIKENFGNIIDYLSIIYGNEQYFKNINIFTSEEITENTINNNYIIITNYNSKFIGKSNNIIKIEEGLKDEKINNILILDDEIINEFQNAEKNIEKEILEFFLMYIFRKKGFREGQFESIKGMFLKNDMLVLLPTGGGKSLIFQLYSLLTPGTLLVICPLISLIEDQVDNLKKCGIDNVKGILNDGEKSKNKILKELAYNNPIFIYISPEKIQTNEFRNFINIYKSQNYINFIVIDEAHCVSEWGHDFRFSYLNIGNTIRKICKNTNIVPNLLALTGTASNSVLKDIQRELNIFNFENIITPKTFERKELNFEIIKCKSNEKEKVLKEIITQNLPNYFNDKNLYELKGDKTNSGVIFCPHATGEFGVEKVSNILKDIGGISYNCYGGKQTEKDKIKITKQFKDNKFSILVATRGFGMGIDKPNIRFTIHYGLPNSIESFYQEAGRSGRDGQKSKNYLILSNDDEIRSNKILNPNTEIKEISKILKITNTSNSDDIIRSIWFHFQGFRGINDEIIYINDIIEKIYYSGDNILKIPMLDETKTFIEKSIQRLLLIGILEDYLVDYINKEYILYKSNISIYDIKEKYLNYIKNYNIAKIPIENEKINSVIEKNNGNNILILKDLIFLLLSFIYDTIEKGRRRGIKEVLMLGNKSNKDISYNIVKYLEGSKIEALEKLINESPITFSRFKNIIGGYEENGLSYGGIISPIEAEKIKGYAIRYLESYPDNPQLILLKAISELFLFKNSNLDNIVEEIFLSKKYAYKKYGLSKELFIEILIWSLIQIYNINNKEYNFLILKLLNKLDDFTFVRNFISKKGFINDDILEIPYLRYFAYISDKYIEVTGRYTGVYNKF